MVRCPCHGTAALAGSQAWRDGRGRQALMSCMSVQERPAQAKQAGGPPIVPALPLRAEIMGGVQGKWLAWPSGGAGLEI